MGALDRWPGLAGVESLGPASFGFPRICGEASCIFILGASSAEGVLFVLEVDTERGPLRLEVCMRESGGPMGQE